MEYKHFSHEHTLTIYEVQSGQQFQCNGCHLPCQDSIFACWKCSFFLHEHCGNAHRYVKHPFHSSHPLVLVPTPTYCSGSFLCNGCGRPGSSFSYCCPMCEVDLHVPCAYLPPKVSLNSHQHEVHISFRPLDEDGSPQYCKICSKGLGYKHWYYFCDKPECDFRVHTFCATTEVKPGLYQDDEPDQEPVQILIYTPSNNTQETCTSSQSEAAARPEEAPKTEDVLSEMFRLQTQFQMQNAMFQTVNSIINSYRI